MATLKHIRKRIKSVKNTQKITKAMKMVAAAKLRRAQQAMLAARPYSKELARLLADMMRGQAEELALYPLLAPRPDPKKTAVVAFTSDRGLCGGFNTAIVKRVQAVVAEEKLARRPIDLIVYGRKGRDTLTAKAYAIAEAQTDIGKWTADELRLRLQALIERYVAGDIDRICLIYNRFVSAISQEVTLKQLLPFATPAAESARDGLDYEYEPSKPEFLAALVEKSLFSNFYLAYLESVASELGARMSAMDSATSNASEMIRKLTLKYNRARQAAITLELMDIVNGAKSVA